MQQEKSHLMLCSQSDCVIPKLGVNVNRNYRAMCGHCSQFAGGLGILKLSVEVIDTLQLSLVQQLHRKSRNNISLSLPFYYGLAMNIA